MTPRWQKHLQDVLSMIKDRKKPSSWTFKFIDVLGMWHHFSIPAHRFDDDSFSDGLPFDGSSVRGFQTIDESDMLLVPDAGLGHH